MTTITCFKAYDVRGRVPEELNEDVVYRIGRGYAEFLRPRTVAVSRDIRLSSDALADVLIGSLLDAGVNVVDIGVGGTEMVYYATFSRELDGGIMVTASHNPPNYNGMKFVREGGTAHQCGYRAAGHPGTGRTRRIRRCVHPGEACRRSTCTPTTSTICSATSIPPNCALSGSWSTPAMAAPDPSSTGWSRTCRSNSSRFTTGPTEPSPNGVPNPMLEENRRVTAETVTEERADAGIAWDGDFDRCFFFDENGRFIDGYYVVGLLAQSFLDRSPGARIVHDPRLTWNTLEVVEKCGGDAVQSVSGHAFMKQAMRDADAVYGGEMSAHHYFRSFAYADSGMIPWLLVTQLMSERGQPLSALVDERMERFPASGEINRTVDDAAEVLARIERIYAGEAERVEQVDGLSMEFSRWRFNLRASNTEPLLRLNVESRGDAALMQARTAELLEQISG